MLKALALITNRKQNNPANNGNQNSNQADNSDNENNNLNQNLNQNNDNGNRNESIPTTNQPNTKCMEEVQSIMTNITSTSSTKKTIATNGWIKLCDNEDEINTNLNGNSIHTINNDIDSNSSSFPLASSFTSKIIDINQEESITLESFHSLLLTARTMNKSFIIAQIITSTNTCSSIGITNKEEEIKRERERRMERERERKTRFNDNQEESDSAYPCSLKEDHIFYSYYGAHNINKLIFRTQPEANLLHRMRCRNPLNNMTILDDGVRYYAISPQEVDRALERREMERIKKRILKSNKREMKLKESKEKNEKNEIYKNKNSESSEYTEFKKGKYWIKGEKSHNSIHCRTLSDTCLLLSNRNEIKNRNMNVLLFQSQANLVDTNAFNVNVNIDADNDNDIDNNSGNDTDINNDHKIAIGAIHTPEINKNKENLINPGNDCNSNSKVTINGNSIETESIKNIKNSKVESDYSNENGNEIDKDKDDIDKENIPLIFKAKYIGNDDNFLHSQSFREFFKANSATADGYLLYTLYGNNVNHPIIGPNGIPIFPNGLNGNQDGGIGSRDNGSRITADGRILMGRRGRLLGLWNGIGRPSLTTDHLGFLTPLGFKIFGLGWIALGVVICKWIIPKDWILFVILAMTLVLLIVMLFFTECHIEREDVTRDGGIQSNILTSPV